MIESETVNGKFYCVQYVNVEELDGKGGLVCDCPAYTYGMIVPCKHILSITVRETA